MRLSADLSNDHPTVQPRSRSVKFKWSEYFDVQFTFTKQYSGVEIYEFSVIQKKKYINEHFKFILMLLYHTPLSLSDNGENIVMKNINTRGKKSNFYKSTISIPLSNSHTNSRTR